MSFLITYINTDSMLLQLLKMTPLFSKSNKPIQCVVHASSISALECKPIGVYASCNTALMVVIHIKYSVCQPTCTPHDRDRAVPVTRVPAGISEQNH